METGQGQSGKSGSSVSFPVGTTYELGGLYESQQSSFHDLLSVLGLALAAVLIVLVIQFRSFAPSLIILSAAPLSLLGVFAMLLITKTALNVSSFMGIILMVGLVVKNGIILFERVATTSALSRRGLFLFFCGRPATMPTAT